MSEPLTLAVAPSKSKKGRRGRVRRCRRSSTPRGYVRPPPAQTSGCLSRVPTGQPLRPLTSGLRCHELNLVANRPPEGLKERGCCRVGRAVRDPVRPRPSAPYPRRLAATVGPMPETAPHAYTRDEFSGDAEAPAPRQLGKRRVAAGPCQQSRGVCTRGIGFPTSARPLGTVLPGTASRVYTRDALSDPDAVPAPLQQARRAGGMAPMSEIPWRVYTRDELSGVVRPSAGGAGRADGPRGKPAPMPGPLNLALTPHFSDFRWPSCP